MQMYPTTLVFPDGSTITARYHEPRRIVKLPVLLEDLQSEAERTAWLRRRKTTEKVEIKDDVTDVSYDSNKYLKMFKQK